ncbi:hypothetical protein TL16_g00201 [Triparma laevis f. inornata]|uniref:Sfi1 spindle body domain-containing protein n=1 Tax=Triparma laevis f. inornata TaxID=1714386 RepID=A0A9W6ZBF6_9STRA|nr:hypothetical protein TL16_g00201 [Triparma laevis f. inornata]
MVVMRHRLKTVYLTFIADTFEAWLKDTISKRDEAKRREKVALEYYEQDSKREEQIDKFIIKTYRRIELEVLRHAWKRFEFFALNKKSNAMERLSVALDKARYDEKLRGIVKRRISSMISHNMRWSWKSWERYVDNTKKAEALNMSIDNENQVNNSTLKIILRHRIKQMYLDNIKDAFVEWLALTLELRAEAEQTARDMEKLKIIMRQRFRDLMGGHMRWAWENLLRNSFEESRIALMKSKKDMQIADSSHAVKIIMRHRLQTLISDHLRHAWKTWEHFVDDSRKEEILNASINNENQVKNSTLRIILRHRIKQMYLDNLKDAFVEWLSLTLELRKQAEQTARDMEKLKIIMRQRFRDLMGGHLRWAWENLRENAETLKKKEHDKAQTENKLRSFVKRRLNSILHVQLRWAWKNWELYTVSVKRSEIAQKSANGESQARSKSLQFFLRNRVKQVYYFHTKAGFSQWLTVSLANKKEAEKKAREDDRLRVIVKSRIRAIVTNELRWSWTEWQRAVYELQKGALTKQRQEELEETRLKTLKIHVKHMFLSLYISNLRSAVSIWSKAIEAMRREEREREQLRLEEEKKSFAITSCMRVRFNRIYENNLRMGFNVWAKAIADRRSQEIEEEGNNKRLRLIVRSRIKSVETEGLLWAWGMWLKSMNIGDKEKGDNRAIRFFMRNRLKLMYDEFTRSAWVRWMKYVAEDKKNDEQTKREEDKIRAVVKRRIRVLTLRELRWGLVTWTKSVFEMKKEELQRAREEEEVKSNYRHLYVLVRHRIKKLYLDYLRLGFVIWLNAAHALKDEEYKSALVEGEKRENEGRRRVTMKRLLARLFANQQRTAFGNWLKYTDMVRLAMDEAMADTRKLKSLVRRRLLFLYNEALRDSFLTWFRFSEKVGQRELALGMKQETQLKAAKIIIVSINRFWRRKLSRAFGIWYRKLSEENGGMVRMARTFSRRLSQEDIFTASGKSREKGGPKGISWKKIMFALALLVALVALIAGSGGGVVGGVGVEKKKTVPWGTRGTRVRHEARGEDTVGEVEVTEDEESMTVDNGNDSDDQNEKDRVKEKEKEKEKDTVSRGRLKKRPTKTTKIKKRKGKTHDVTQKGHFAWKEPEWLERFKLA